MYVWMFYGILFRLQDKYNLVDKVAMCSFYNSVLSYIAVSMSNGFRE